MEADGGVERSYGGGASAACQDCAVAGQCPPQRPGENAKTVNELRTELAASQVRVREVESKFAENFVVIESEAKEIANERVPSGLTG